MPYKKGHTSWNRGKKMEETAVQNMSLAQKERYKNSAVWNKGIKMSIGARDKMRKAKLGITGEKSNAWKGGISRNKHSLSRPEYKNWRDGVFKRDDWTCQECGERGVVLEAHHIKSWSGYPEFRFSIDNGITLCRDCHIEIDLFRKRFIKK